MVSYVVLFFVLAGLFVTVKSSVLSLEVWYMSAIADQLLNLDALTFSSELQHDLFLSQLNLPC